VARRRYSSCTALTSGVASISNSVHFFRRLRADLVERGEVRHGLQAGAQR
jgi:hypothetical protein